MAGLEVRWKPHADFERMLADVFQDDPIEGIKELVANGFDADATRFDISYYPDRRVLTTKDNGNGMGVDELQNGFYKSGDSLTKKAGKTKKGRVPLGSYGIGTIVMQYLARNYTLETWRGGQQLTVQERFIDGIRPDSTLKAIPKKCEPSLRGTSITIDPTRFSPDEFTLDQLTRRLALGLNVEPRLEKDDKFDMYVNGEKVELKNPNPALFFSINRYDELIGHVYGSVKFYGVKPPYGGVIVRVNGRQVGSEESLDNLIPTIMQRRVYAEINVDSMVSRISFNRARFQEDSAHFRRLIEIIDGTFKSFRGEVEGYARRRLVSLGRRAIETATSRVLGQVSYRANNLPRDAHYVSSATPQSPASNDPATLDSNVELDGERNLGDILLSVDYEGRGKIVLVADKSPAFGSIDQNTGIITINVSHPYFTLPKTSQEDSLQLRLLYALSNIMGRNSLDSGVSSKNLGALKARDEAISRLSSQVFSGQPKLLETLMLKRSGYSAKRGLSPDRMYSNSELYQESPIDRIWLGKFQKAGILRPTVDGDDERYFGANVILALERLKGGTPAFQLVRELVEGRTEVTRAANDSLIQRIDEQIDGLYSKLPFAFNVSVTDDPLFVILAGYESRFQEIYKAGHIKARHTIPPEFLEFDQAPGNSQPKNPAVGHEGSVSRTLLEYFSKENRLPEGIKTSDLGRATVYNAMGKFKDGDLVIHDGFGYGVVVGSQSKTFVVRFRDSTISLAHNRQSF